MADGAVPQGRPAEDAVPDQEFVKRADSLGPGTVADVLVTGAAPHHLMGNLVAVTARASRPRIPVVAI